MAATIKKKSKRGTASEALEFNHGMLYAKDVAASVHFYVDLLGFRLVDEFRHEGMLVYARLRSPRGNNTIAIHMLEPGKVLPDYEGVRLYFEVKNLPGFCKKLEAAGVTLDAQPKMMPWGWMHAYVSDPDGHELSLYWAGSKRLKKSEL
jgi:catechol 2,3-dioxygenase-like lactoylglutathione lyase family enzyme